MKRALFLVCGLLLLTLGLQAQKLTVEKMELGANDLSASVFPRNDLNGEPCGLVKVQLAIKGAVFEGSIINPVENKTGEYWVYMPEGSYMLQVKHDSFLPLMLNFRDYGIKRVEQKTTYVLTLLLPTGSNLQILNEHTDNGKTINSAYSNLLFQITDSTKKQLYYVNIEGNRISNIYDDDYRADDYYRPLTGNHFMVFRNKKMGVIDSLGREVVPCEYDYLWDCNGILETCDYHSQKNYDDHTYGLMSIDGKTILPCIYKGISYCKDGDKQLFICKKEHSAGVVDSSGKTIIPFEYNEIDFDETYRLFSVYKNDEHGFLDTDGKVVVELKYVGHAVCWSNYENSMHIAKRGDAFYAIDLQGKEHIIGVYDDVSINGSIKDDMVLVVKKDRDSYLYGYVNIYTGAKIPCIYTKAKDFSEGLAFVKKTNGEYVYINNKGKEVLKSVTDDFNIDIDFSLGDWGFHNGVAPFIKNGLVGLMDKTGKIVIKPQFSDLRWGFLDGPNAWGGYAELIPAERDGKWGFINRKGHTIIPFFDCDSWEAMEDGGWFVIDSRLNRGTYDKYGNVIFPCLYQYYSESCIPNIYMVENSNHSFGYYDLLNRKEIVPCIYNKDDAPFMLLEYLKNKDSKQIDNRH